MKRYNHKLEVFDAIKQFLGFSKIIVTGSTALQMYGLTTKSDPFDLDLIIYDIKEPSFNLLTQLHKMFGSEQIIYSTPNRDAGTLVTMTFPSEYGAPTAEIMVHVFLMSEKTEENQARRPYCEMKVGDKHFYVQNPMNIIEAKKQFAREKDWIQLAEMCSTILKPLEKRKTENKPTVGAATNQATDAKKDEKTDQKN